MVTVHVPATSANLGAGFDSIGIALDMGNTVKMEEADGCHIEPLDNSLVPTDESNLVYRSAQVLYRECGRPFRGLYIGQVNNIPMARGLGSSSACIVAGLVGANRLLGDALPPEQLLRLSARIEGHPDNVAPALYGGFVASCVEDGQVYSVRQALYAGLRYMVFVPDFKLLTREAREALPAEVAHRDAVYNLSRAALCQAALCDGRIDLLPVATQDRLHQPFRLPLIAGGEEVFSLAKNAGALAVCISGAGPSIMAITEESNAEAFSAVAEQALQAAREAGAPAGRFILMPLRPDNTGAHCV